MKITIKRYSLPEILGLTALAIFLLFSLLSITLYAQYISTKVYFIALFGIILLIFLKELISESYNLKSVIGLFVICTLCFIIGNVTNYAHFFILGLLLIYSLRNLPFLDVAKVSFIISISVVLSSKLGIIPDYIEISPTRVRHYLGFRYSLFPSTLMMNIIAISFFLKQGNTSYPRLFVLFLLSGWLYVETDSRLTFINSCLFLLVNLIMKFSPSIIEKVGRLLKLFTFTYFINAGLSYWIAKTYLNTSNVVLNQFLYQADQFLGGRIYYANRSLSLYGYKLLGQKIDWIGNGLSMQGERSIGTYLYVDNLYIQTLQHFGLIVSVIILSLLTITLVKLLKKGQMVLGIILVILSFHALIDDLILNLYYNIFWVLIGMLIYKKYQFYDKKQLTIE